MTKFLRKGLFDLAKGKNYFFVKRIADRNGTPRIEKLANVILLSILYVIIMSYPE